MAGEFNDSFRNAELLVSPHLNNGACVDISAMSQADKDAFKFVLNRYEFLAAGIRNGDFDEQLVSDSLRSPTIKLYNICEESIRALRAGRRSQAAYEHLEWLTDRWTERKPGFFQRPIEWMWGRPFTGKRH